MEFSSKRLIIKLSKHYAIPFNNWLSKNKKIILATVQNAIEKKNVIPEDYKIDWSNTIYQISRINIHKENKEVFQLLANILYESLISTVSSFITDYYQNDYERCCANWNQHNIIHQKNRYLNNMINNANRFYQDKEIRLKLVNDFIDIFIVQNKPMIHEISDQNSKQENLSYKIPSSEDFEKLTQAINESPMETIELSNNSTVEKKEIVNFLKDIYRKQFSSINEITPIIRTKRFKDFVQSDDFDEIFIIDNIDELNKSVKANNRGKNRKSLESIFIHQPFMIGLDSTAEYFRKNKRKLFSYDPNIIENQEQGDVNLSFKMKLAYQIKLGDLYDNLNAEFYFINEEYTSKADFIKIMTAKDLSKIQLVIRAGCNTNVFATILEGIEDMFDNLIPATIEKSGLFRSKKGKPISAESLSNGRFTINKHKKEKIRQFIKQI